jgi:hypothetical protein
MDPTYPDAQHCLKVKQLVSHCFRTMRLERAVWYLMPRFSAGRPCSSPTPTISSKSRTQMVDIGTGNHGLNNYIDTKAKCRHLKKFTCKGTLSS